MIPDPPLSAKEVLGFLAFSVALWAVLAAADALLGLLLTLPLP